MLARAADTIDEEVFLQLLELDEEGETDFLEGVANDWYADAQKTLNDLDREL